MEDATEKALFGLMVLLEKATDHTLKATYGEEALIWFRTLRLLQSSKSIQEVTESGTAYLDVLRNLKNPVTGMALSDKHLMSALETQLEIIRHLPG